MEYIVHRRYKGRAACGDDVNFPYGSKFNTIGKFIAYNNKAICATTSEVAHMYFARNNDGQGLLRGKITWAIAFKPVDRSNGERFRLTEKQREILCNKWERFLIPNIDFVLFNNDFFNAEIIELKQLAYELGVDYIRQGV